MTQRTSGVYESGKPNSDGSEELFIVIYLIYYTAVFDKEAYEVIQKLTDSLESMGTVLIYEPYKFQTLTLIPQK